jgi:uncharacterized NAD(P)/FAD-binding protein YdhS
MKNIAIIGGGFSGAITAVNLGRLSAGPLKISIIDKNPVPCRGIAYSTRNPSHLLNVAARNMSALADQPNHFVEWLGTRVDCLDIPDAVLRENYLPRRVYGEYIHSLFQWYTQILSAEKQMQFEVIHDDAINVLMEDKTATVVLAGGRTVPADTVVLAVGNQTPIPFRLRGLDPKSARYIGNPWLGWEKKLPSKEENLLIIGTGLTMVDTFLSLKDFGWRGKVFAVSRNGLLPISHFKGFEYPDFINDAIARRPFRELFSIFKKHWREAQAKNINPAILVDKFRPYTQRIWQNFSLAEKKQFNRHFRTRWNVMRHRIAPEIHRQLQEAIAQGWFNVVKGRLRDCAESEGAMTISLDSNGARRVLKVGAVINCTGPKDSYLPSDSALLNNLFDRGLIQPDDMNMGIRVTPDYAAVDRAGHASETIFAIGSIMKGTLWETLAVPELRSQAFRLAETISGQWSDREAKKSAISEVMEDVIEYSI